MDPVSGLENKSVVASKDYPDYFWSGEDFETTDGENLEKSLVPEVARQTADSPNGATPTTEKKDRPRRNKRAEMLEKFRILKARKKKRQNTPAQ
ncbi:MAG: hypothetical protein HYT12_02940 [Candidatus Liptonbacteria bacterium]|nr:hypothetical protein [Candidatus Liptonbacteria bacterium]